MSEEPAAFGRRDLKARTLSSSPAALQPIVPAPVPVKAPALAIVAQVSGKGEPRTHFPAFERCPYRPSGRRHLVGLAGAASMMALLGGACVLLWSTADHQPRVPHTTLTVVRITAPPVSQKAEPKSRPASAPRAPSLQPRPPEKTRAAAVAPYPREIVTPISIAAASTTEPTTAPLLTISPLIPASTRMSPPPALPPSSPTASKAPDAGWQGRLMARLAAYRRYPADARLHREQGTASVRFRMNREGRVLWAQLAASSGSALLDAAALDTVNRAAPLPKLPQGMPDELTLTLPIAFSLH